MEGVAFIMDKYIGIRNEKVHIYCGYKEVSETEKSTFIVDKYRYRKRRSPHLLWIRIDIRNRKVHIHYG